MFLMSIRRITRTSLTHLLLNSQKFTSTSGIRQLTTRRLNSATSASTFLYKSFSSEQSSSSSFQPTIFLVAGILSFFKKDDSEETPEQKLIMTIKRSILFIQREQYEKAEQMLHLALRMAQDMQSKDGVTYVYDVMANLAMEREQFQKAEKLFVDVMRRLFNDGHREDSLKIIHISSKIARMAHLQGNSEKALQGFRWTLDNLEEKMKELQDNKDVKELWGLTRHWYGQLLMDLMKFAEAKQSFMDAYEIYKTQYEKVSPELISLLNNISVACMSLDDYIGARKWLEEALELSKEFPDLVDVGILKANLGLVYLREGLINQARELCSLAWKFGKKMESDSVIDQADYCLKKIKETTTK